MDAMHWMHTARTIVAERQAQYVHPYTGELLYIEDDAELPEFPDESGELFPAVLLDLTTAMMLDYVWNNLSPDKQAEYETYGLAGAVELGWKIVSAAKQH